MVRPSLFSRLFGRLRGNGGSAVATAQVSMGRAAGEVAGHRFKPVLATAESSPSRMSTAGAAIKPATQSGAATPVAEAKPPEVQAVPVTPPKKEPIRVEPPKDVKATKLAPQEELSLKISEGISTLSDLLGNIDDKLGLQNRKNQELVQGVQALPKMMEGLVHVQKSNLEALRDVRDAMADQQKAAETRHTAMKGLLSGQREAVLHNGLQLEKIPGKFDELGDNLSHQTRAQGEIKGSVEAVGKSVRSLADGAQRAQNTLLAEFRRAQDEHGRRLEDLVERERKMSLIVGGLGFLVVVCLVFILVKTTA